jgi:hypothetical protein
MEKAPIFRSMAESGLFFFVEYQEAVTVKSTCCARTLSLQEASLAQYNST